MKHPVTPLAKDLRWNATPAEKRLWHYLRQRPLGFKFRRQVPIGPYIADFACLDARLVIEVDGKFHGDQPADVARDAFLASRGWEVVRWWNRDVRLRLHDIADDLERRLRVRLDDVP